MLRIANIILHMDSNYTAEPPPTMDNQTNNGASIDFAKSGQILHLQNTIHDSKLFYTVKEETLRLINCTFEQI